MRNILTRNRVLTPFVPRNTIPKFTRSVEKMGMALGLFPDHLVLRNTNPVVWDVSVSHKAILEMTANRTLRIDNPDRRASGSLFYNPKGFTLTLPANSKIKKEFNGRLLFDDFVLPTADSWYTLDFIYIDSTFHWSFGVYENL